MTVAGDKDRRGSLGCVAGRSARIEILLQIRGYRKV